MIKEIRTNSKGKLIYDINENIFHVEFGVVKFELPMDEYLKFERLLKEHSNDLSIYNSTEKIKIPVKFTGITLILTPEDLLSLNDLFGFKSEKLRSFKLKINYSIN